MNADDSARVRDLLASNRTLLAWVRTSISFSALGFAVAKFELRPDQELAPPGSPQPTRWPGMVATACCLGVCVVLLPYLAVSVT